MADTKLLQDDHVTVSVVGTTGSVATPTAAAVNGIVTGTVAKTPSGQPNLLVNVVPPVVALVVRFANMFLTAFLGALGAGAIGAAPSDWTWKVAAGVALGAAVLDLVKNLITIFGKLENKYPLATGSI